MTEINMLTTFLLSFSALYVLSALYLLSIRHPKKTNNSKKYKVSVLIAVRNEENFLRGCLQALSEQDYDSEMYDVFILDDDSSDRSAIIAKTFCDNFHNFHYTRIEKQHAGLKGKMNVLAQALQKLKGDLVLITDADCIVPPTWIDSITAYFDDNTGLIGSLTSLYPFAGIQSNQTEKVFHIVQTLDWFFLQAIARFSGNAGKPITVLGNNFAFNLKAYHETGGFEKIGFSVTEDYALLRAIEKSGRWQIKYINDPRAAIFSYPLNSFKAFFLQRLRWIKGGKTTRPWAYFLMLTSFIAHLLLLITLIINPLNPLTILLLFFVFISDYQTIKGSLEKLKLNKLKTYFILFEGFYIIYTLLFSVYFLFPVKIKWKGRAL